MAERPPGWNHPKMAYTVEEAACLLSLSRAQAYRLIDVGEIGTVKIGGCRRITHRQLDDFLVRTEAAGGTPRLPGR